MQRCVRLPAWRHCSSPYHHVQRVFGAHLAAGPDGQQPCLTEQQIYPTWETTSFEPGWSPYRASLFRTFTEVEQRAKFKVDLNIADLQAQGLSPSDVVNAIGAQNIILPTGTAKIGPFEYQVDMNGSPLQVNCG